MDVLLVEDDSFKQESIARLLSSMFEGVDIESVVDVRSAVKAVNRRSYDLIIIDMALPSHAITAGGGAPMSLLTGGLEVVLELAALDRTDPAIIVTQYPEIEIGGKFFPVGRAAQEIGRRFGYQIAGCVEYSEDAAAWHPTFVKILQKS